MSASEALFSCALKASRPRILCKFAHLRVEMRTKFEREGAQSSGKLSEEQAISSSPSRNMRCISYILISHVYRYESSLKT